MYFTTQKNINATKDKNINRKIIFSCFCSSQLLILCTILEMTLNYTIREKKREDLELHKCLKTDLLSRWADRLQMFLSKQ